MNQGPGPTGWSAARLAVVGELASLINTTYDLHEIFRAAIVKLRGVLAFRRASVLLVTDDRTHYYLHTLYDATLAGFVHKEGTFPLDQGLPGQAIRTGKAMRIDDFRGTEGIRAEGEGNVSALIVPLRLDGTVIGTLNFGAGESSHYGDADLELAVLLAQQVETSLHYSKLFATIEHQRDALAEEHAKVQSEHSRLEALIEASDAAILMVTDGKVAHANRAMAEFLGIPWEVVVGAPVERIHRALARSLANPEALTAQILALQPGGEPLRDRVELVFPRRLTCQRTVTAVLDAEGNVLGHLVLYRDVTREAEAEAAKSEFVSIVSHELRTPLTSVKTSLTLLMKGAAGTVTDKMQEFLEIALRNLERLIRLVDDLLDLSKIQSGRIAIDLVPVAVKEAAGRALEAVHGFAQEREVRLECGASDDATLVLADADRLEQVIVNLLSNAVKFSPPGGRVALRWWSDGECAVLEISDEGPGIPADQLRTIFEKFRQVERASTRMHGGAGLGLAISRTIVEHFGGDLWVESEEGHGSRFYVRLKLTEETRPSREPVSEVAAGPRHVLVVEKDPDALRLFQAQFEHEGWQVVARSEGAEALRHVGRGFPDLIAVGMELVDMHGLEFLQRLRQVPASVDTPTLLVGPGGDSAQAVAYGADGWVEGDAEALVEEAKRLVAAPRRPIVLVIEDDPAVRGALARILRHARYACLEAASGDTGLALARERPPDLVMTDWQIPGMDGPALLRAMRGDARLAKIPVIVVTGHAEPRVAETAASLGASLITKPFDAVEVIREVERLMSPERVGVEPNESAG